MKSFTYISGTTGFFGSKLTEHLASKGKNLLFGGQDEKKLQKIIAGISERYPNQNFQGITCDLASPESWQSAGNALKEFSVNEYINCSAIQGQLGPNSEIDDEEIKKVFNVNLFSSIFFTNLLSSKLREGDKLSVIHFSGGGATSARPLFMSYSLSKTCLLRFVENFSAENSMGNVKINAIAPGVMPSKMQREILDNVKLRESKDHLIAVKSLADKELDITKLINLCDFLLTEKSEGITGKLISAEWDNWEEWPNHLDEIRNSDLYTLRRITGRDRGQEWGDL
jgi:3-oxoacyl-[acyl-carrier protein] reductase